MKRLLIAISLLLVAVLVLGCTSSHEQPKGIDVVETPVETPVQPEVVEPTPKTTVYNAPLTGSTDKICQTDDDCVLVKYVTGLGEDEECMGPAADYDGAQTNDCLCKEMDGSTQTLGNGTEIVTKSYECRHI